MHCFVYQFVKEERKDFVFFILDFVCAYVNVFVFIMCQKTSFEKDT